MSDENIKKFDEALLNKKKGAYKCKHCGGRISYRRIRKDTNNPCTGCELKLLLSNTIM